MRSWLGPLKLHQLWLTVPALFFGEFYLLLLLHANDELVQKGVLDFLAGDRRRVVEEPRPNWIYIRANAIDLHSAWNQIVKGPAGNCSGKEDLQCHSSYHSATHFEATQEHPVLAASDAAWPTYSYVTWQQLAISPAKRLANRSRCRRFVSVGRQLIFINWFPKLKFPNWSFSIGRKHHLIFKESNHGQALRFISDGSTFSDFSGSFTTSLLGPSTDPGFSALGFSTSKFRTGVGTTLGVSTLTSIVGSESLTPFGVSWSLASQNRRKIINML